MKTLTLLTILLMSVSIAGEKDMMSIITEEEKILADVKVNTLSNELIEIEQEAKFLESSVSPFRTSTKIKKTLFEIGHLIEASNIKLDEIDDTPFFNKSIYVVDLEFYVQELKERLRKLRELLHMEQLAI